ncbi:membrane dipeptidase [Pseudotabrizicola alkalilacus]|uniref:Membrane dipeptidase n=2 Tax=Pseudotabrizicola alkalilacus TaxID=2305252 RepID=A0A411Z036_9RHOB|nr:dipeptidase [Pseudotabrizicola alkalilacus]RGP36417.1 membrane dipeptidase [Pseudotabrizicola alkalilacus]
MMDFPVFDGHNDFLLRLYNAPDRREELWLKGETDASGKTVGHLDLPRMRQGGFAGGLFAIYIPSPIAHDSADYQALMDTPPYDLPLPDLIDARGAQPVALSMAAHLHWMARAAPDDFTLCTTATQIRAAMADGRIAGVMHMEGAEAISPNLDELPLWHAMGLRSIGPVWSRPTVFGDGVPFRYPGDPDTGPGLTDAGRALVRACAEMRIMLDLSHMNEAGFNDVARISDGPLVATHSNAHAVTPSTRNLTDRQLAMIAESGGLVGLNFATSFLRPDGRQSPAMDWDPVMRHLDHLLAHLGEEGVGLGSDFDGATIPEGIGDVTGLPALLQAMIRHGFGAELVEKIAHRNWLALLHRIWGA